MIAKRKRGESTSLSSIADDGGVFASKKPCEKTETRSIFHELNTSELLKHLLKSRVTNRESREKTNEGEKTPESIQRESSQENDAHEDFMTKPAFCSLISDDKRSFVVDSDIFYSTFAPGGSYSANSPSFPEVKHGRMDEPCDERDESDGIQSHLYPNEVQIHRNDLRRNISVESAISEDFSDGDLSRLSSNVLASETLDFILYGTENELCIQSPTESQNDPSDVTSEFTEFAELVPFGNDPTEMETSDFSPVASTSGFSSEVSNKTCTNVKEDNDSSSSEDNVNNAMVLVPTVDPVEGKCENSTSYQLKSETVVPNAPISTMTNPDGMREDEECGRFMNEITGVWTVINSGNISVKDPLEWTSTHIKSWLDWITRKFSLQPKPDPEKFPGTGSEICDLSRTDFEVKAGSSRSGRGGIFFVGQFRGRNEIHENSTDESHGS